MKKNRMVSSGVVMAVLVLVLVLSSVALLRVKNRWDARRTTADAGAVTNEPAAGPSPTDDVALVGDSITEQSEAVLHDTLDQAYRVRIRGRGGYRIEEMEPYAIELTTTKPEQVVINLGTNDVLKNWPVDKATAAMNRLVEQFKNARCVYIVTITEGLYSEYDAGQAARALVFNVELRRIARSHQIKVIDWAEHIAQDIAAGSPKGDLTYDTVHPSVEGQRQLAALYRTALDGCS